MDPVPVADRVVEPLEDQRRRPLAGHGAVGPGVEGAGDAGGAEGVQRRGPRRRPRVACEVHGADEGAVDPASPQRPDGGLQGAQPARLLALQAEGGPAEAELPREPARHHPPQRPHGAVGGEGRVQGVAQAERPGLHLRGREPRLPLRGPPPRLRQQRPAEVEVRGVEVEAHAHEDPRGGVRGVGSRAGVLEGVGGGHEHHRLLRQHLLQLPRRDPEAVEGDADLREVVARGGGEAEGAGVPLGGHGAAPAEDPLLELPEGGPGAEAGGHADHGHGDPRLCIIK